MRVQQQGTQIKAAGVNSIKAPNNCLTLLFFTFCVRSHYEHLLRMPRIFFQAVSKLRAFEANFFRMHSYETREF